jgi:hypothetical protein
MAMVNHFSNQLNQIDKVVNRNHIHIGWVPITTFLYPQTKHTLILLSSRLAPYRLIVATIEDTARTHQPPWVGST